MVTMPQQTPTTVPYQVFQQEKQLRHAAEAENRQIKKFISWEDELFSNPNISGNHKLEIRATRRAVQHAQTRDAQGRARINLTTIAEQIGVSPDTMSRGLKVLEQCGVIANKVTRPEVQENGERWTRYYIKLDEELLQQPKEIKPPEPRNHGGQRYTCQKCGSDQVKIRKHITLVCKCCKHESLLEDSEHDQEPAAQETQASNLNEQGRNLQDIIKPVTPPHGVDCAVDQGDPEDKKQDAAQDNLELRAAAELLLALAGQADEHIEMSRSGAKKYYTVDRPLAIGDLLDHLRGGKARGAECRYPDDQSRGLCWDADDQEGWQLLERAAGQLAHAGYLPILEKSPADRGGHLWIIYTDLVNASAARLAVCAIAPDLATLLEYWPGPQDAKRWNRVRLPGARYVRPGVSAWCQLISAADGESSTDGRSAASLLISHQTPASVVPTIRSQEPDPVSPAAPPAEVLPNDLDEMLGNDQDSNMLPNSSKMRLGVDSQWYERYNTEQGKRLWFAWSPQYVAAWWNERHDLDELLPDERNGYGLASWRGERTASVAKDKTGERWADFGASARRADGSPDTGDALELQVRVSQVPKPEVMRQAARELLQEARQALESAARSGQPFPAWLEEIVTDEGRAHYQRLRSQAENVTLRFEGQLQDVETGVASANRNNNVLRIHGQVTTKIAETTVSANHQASVAPISATQGGLTGFLLAQESDQVGSQVQEEGLRGSAVCSSEPKRVLGDRKEEWRRLEAIRDWGKVHEWPSLVLTGEEIIPAGRKHWLDFIWLSCKEDEQRRAYEYIIR